MKKYRVISGSRMIETQIPGKYAGIITTKIFGCLDCPSGKRAKKENRLFFAEWDDAICMGYRPCKVCKPVRE